MHESIEGDALHVWETVMNSNNQVSLGSLRGIGIRVIYAALACVLAFSTLVSVLVIADLHDHDCTGDDCPICLVLEVSQAVLTLAASGAATGALALAFGITLVVVVMMRELFLPADNPVSLKVRLVI